MGIPVTVNLKATATELFATLGRATTAMKTFGDSSVTAADRTRMLSTAGMALGGAMATAAAVGIGVAVNAAADFETQLVRLQTAGNETHESVAVIGKGLLSMAGEVGQGATELAHAMLNVSSAGFHGAEGLEVMRAAAQGASITGGDLNTVTKSLATAMDTLDIPASQATATMNQMMQAVKIGTSSWKTWLTLCRTSCPLPHRPAWDSRKSLRQWVL